MRLPLSLPLIFGLFLALAYPAHAGSSPDWKKEMDSQKLRKNVTYFSSDAFRGRLSGTRQLKKAARFLADEFKKQGLQPVEGSYFQKFPLYETGYYKRAKCQVIRGKRGFDLAVNKDFYPSLLSRGGKAKGEVFFAGYGYFLQKRKSPHKSKVKDRIVFLLIPHKKKNLHYLATRLKALKNLGARGVILSRYPFRKSVIPTVPNRWSWIWKHRIVAPNLKKLKDTLAPHLPGISKMGALNPRTMLKRQDYKKLAPYRESGISHNYSLPVIFAGKRLVNILFYKIKKGKKLPSPQVLKKIFLSYSVSLYRERKITQNVVAFRPGDDPSLKDELIVVGAHYDHVGATSSLINLTGRDEIWNGADDNASGTMALVEMARAAKSKKFKSKRSILFIGFAAEEYGLVGAKYYVRNPLFPLKANSVSQSFKKTVAMINLDMVGRNKTNKLTVGGSTYSKDLSVILNEENKFFQIRRTEAFITRSDQYPFYREKIPVLFFNSGMHGDYHEPSDEADKVNYEKILRVANLALKIVYRVGNGKKPPQFTSPKKKKKRRRKRD